MRRNLLRFGLLVAAVVYGAAVASSFTGQWLLEHPSVANLERGIHLFPRNPLLWGQYARLWLFHADGFQPRRAVDAYLKAVALNPLDLSNWEGVADAYTQLGEAGKAETALRAGLIAVPRSPRVAWRLANFLLLQGRQEEAIPYIRAAAEFDPGLRAPAYHLGLKILDGSEAVLQRLVPSRLEARIGFLNFLMETGRIHEGYEVWRVIRPARVDAVWKVGYDYVERLALSGLGKEAAQVWSDLLSDQGLAWLKPSGELLTNGDFEGNLLSAGLDWHFQPRGPGYQVSLSDWMPQQGSHSLCVTFDGTTNTDFWGVHQYVPAEPNQSYRFRGYVRSENITTDQGVQFRITVPGPMNDNLLLYTPNRIGTIPWTQEELVFQTGPNTSVVQVALRRFQSRKFANLIRGKVWIDNLSIQRHTAQWLKDRQGRVPAGSR